MNTMSNVFFSFKEIKYNNGMVWFDYIMFNNLQPYLLYNTTIYKMSTYPQSYYSIASNLVQLYSVQAFVATYIYLGIV